jgi:hypothetical protein
MNLKVCRGERSWPIYNILLAFSERIEENSENVFEDNQWLGQDLNPGPSV